MWSSLKEMFRGKGSFLVKDAPTKFNALSHFDDQNLAPDDAFDRLLDFYDSHRAKDAMSLDEDGDMLLFQFATYDWGEGANFSVSLLRQFIVAKGEETEIWQLILEYSCAPNDRSAKLGNEEEWCRHPSELPAFRNHILSSPAMSACSATTGKLLWDRV